MVFPMLDLQERKKLSRLAEKNEPPFFALSLERLKANEKKFLKELHSFFPKAQACYSVKTNPLPQVLKALSTGFELASLEELEAVKAKKVFKVFNGCCKRERELKEAVKQEAIIIVDSFSELEKLIMLKKTSGLKKLEVGVRLNVESKFGIELREVPKFLASAEQQGLKVILLHAHPGAGKSLQEYRHFLQKVKKALPLHSWKFVDLGSGFPSFARLAEQNVSLQQYFQLVKEELGTTLLAEHESKGKELCTTFIFEPGRILVADAMFLVCKLHCLKELNNEKIAILDAGINVLQRIVLENFQFTPLIESNGAKSVVRLAGPLLFGNDWLGTTNSNLQEKDLIVVENVGAYCHSLAWGVSYKKPEVFLL